ARTVPRRRRPWYRAAQSGIGGKEGASMGSRISRRRVLAAGTAGLVGTVLPSSAGAAQTPDPTKVQGALGSPLGSRSTFERPTRIPTSPASNSTLTPLQDLEGIITPADLHFERHHGGVPVIDPATYSLLIHGMVE